MTQLARELRVKIDWLFEKIIQQEISWEPSQKEKRFIIAADSKTIGELESLRNAENEADMKRGAS